LKNDKHQNSFAGKGVFPPKYAFTLLLPFRNIFLSPKKLIARLHIKENNKILEIGPGPGYFSLYVARMLKTGKLVLLDIQQEMLELAKKRLDKKGVTNVEYKLTDGKKFNLGGNSFDIVFMVSVIGEVENKKEYLEEVGRVLKDDGLLSISELGGDPDKMNVEEIRSLVLPHKFEEIEIFKNTLSYTINESTLKR
jgi:ubiquinone/menaquinone biosynthesis C-methylase UbiE